MNVTKRTLLTLLCVASATLTAQATKITGWTPLTTSGMNPDYVPTYWQIPTYDNQVVLNGTYLTNLYLNSSHTYVLTGPVVIGNPTNAAIGATIYIQPGTVIRGMPFRNGVGDTASAGLYVSAGSKIIARGMSTNPIIFTDMWDNNVPGMVPGVVKNAANYNGTSDPSSDGWPQGYLGTPMDGLRKFTRDYSTWQPTFGYWGGVIINGRTAVATHSGAAGDASLNSVYAPTNWTAQGNNSSSFLPFTSDEGLTFVMTYGGCGIDGIIDDDDTSGAFTYCSIRYNGYPMKTGTSEINGLSLYGVGRGTEIHHVEIMNTGDDSVEWFGGTVNSKYMVTWAYGDDGWDTDQGFRGKNQFLFAMQGTLQDVINQTSAGGAFKAVIGSAHSDKGMEMDSSDNDGNKRGLPLALSAWWNGTWVGQGPTRDVPDAELAFIASGDTWAKEATGTRGWDTETGSLQPTANSCLMLRDGACPQIYNGIFTEFRGAGIVMEYTACTNGGVAGTKSRLDSHGRVYDVCVNAGRAWNDYPVIDYANPVQYYDNHYLYQSQTPGYQMDLSDCVFYDLGFGAIVPTSGTDMENAAGRETAGTKNDRHLSLRWNGPGSTVYSLAVKNGAAEGGGTSVGAGINTFTQFPGLLSGSLSPNVATAVQRIIDNNELAINNPIGTITRAPCSDYRFAKGVRNVTYIDPYPTTANVLGSRRTPPEDGFYTPVNFKGAFDPTKENWMKGWTLCDKFNLVAMEPATNLTALATDASGASEPVGVTSTIGSYPAVRAESPVAGARYMVEASDDMATWAAVGYIDEDGTDKWFTDASGANHKFFRTSRVK